MDLAYERVIKDDNKFGADYVDMALLSPKMGKATEGISLWEKINYILTI